MQRPLMASGSGEADVVAGPADIRHSCRCRLVGSLLAVGRRANENRMCTCNCPESRPSWLSRNMTALFEWMKGLTCMLVFAIFAAVLGMFQFGYNTGVINAPQSILQKFICDVYYNRTEKVISENFRDFLWSITVSVFAIGGMLGGILGGSIADRYGRKGGLLLNNFMGIVGAVLMALSQWAASFELLIFGRLVIGFNCGLSTALVPMYLSEIAPLTLRGGLGTVNQLGVTIGLLLSQVLGIEVILGTATGWPILLGIAVVPAVLQMILLPFCPESPRYLLISKQEETLAREALQRLRCSSNVEEDIEEMRAEDRGQQQESRVTIWQLLRNSSLRLPLVIGVVMQLSQQLSGINAVLYYSTALFTSAGLTDNAAKYATIGVGAVMVVMTLVSIPLMDRAGRRTLHLYGLGGMFIFSIFITISLLVKFLYHWVTYLSVVSTLSFVVFFAIGPGSIPWMITAELFSQGPRPAAMSVAVLVNWFANFVVGLVFPQMQRLMENYTFLPFTCLLAVFWTFTYKKVPETKNKTFEEISALFRRDDIVNINGMPVPRKSLTGRGAGPAGEMVYEDKPVESSLCQCAHEVIILPELTSLHKWHPVAAVDHAIAASTASGVIDPNAALRLRLERTDEDPIDPSMLDPDDKGSLTGLGLDVDLVRPSSEASSHLTESGRSGSSSGQASDDETSTSDVAHRSRKPSPMQRHPADVLKNRHV